MTTQDTSGEKAMKQEPKPIMLAEFLESTPPNQPAHISDLAAEKWSRNYGVAVDLIRTPEILSHCTSDRCNGPRVFRHDGAESDRLTENWQYFYMTYLCSNCRERKRVFSLAAKVDEAVKGSGRCYKFGELPPFGPPTPARLITLIGPDRDEFLNGRRSEVLGLGVGAFTYYRRVVVNQKNRIIGEVIRVAEKIEPGSDAIKQLKAALSETRFSESLTMVKTAMPQALLINGQNPLTLLHSALSDGVHDRTDEECLQLASSVRVVLGELSERLAQALKDEAEITKALGTLMKRPGSDRST